MNQKTNEYRKKIAELFVKSLQEKSLNWKKGWNAISTVPQNAVTGKKYKGLNRFNLALYSHENNIEDPRWATFKQIKDKGWKLKKGSKGMEVEYWSPYDYANKKPLQWKEYNELLRDPVRKEQIGIIAKYYYVFNAKDIEGIPELEKQPERQIVSDEIIEKISGKMGVEIINESGNRAFYRISEDKIHLPFKEVFHSDYEYNSTALHELSHATGAAHRLNRNIRNQFGTAEYAYEELVAEISATFMGEHLSIVQDASHIENHKAYVQSWINAITEKPAMLIQAIKDADQAANYLELQAELISVKEYENTLSEVREVNGQELEKPASEKNIEVSQDRDLNAEITEDKLQHMIKGHEYSVRNIKALGYEPTLVEGFSDNGFVHFSEIGNQANRFGFDGWEMVNDFVDDVYKIVDNFSFDDINAYRQGNYEVIEYGIFDDNVIETAVKNYDRLMNSRCVSLFYMLTDAPEVPSWIEVHNDLSERKEEAGKEYAKEIADYISAHQDSISEEVMDFGNTLINSLSDGKETSTRKIDVQQDVCNELQSHFSDLCSKATADIIRQNTEWGAWFGRIVNTSRPQDYIEVDITGMSSRHEMLFSVNIVNDNQVVNCSCFTFTTNPSDFEQSVRNGIETAQNWFAEYSKEAAEYLNIATDKTFALYSPDVGQPITEHYNSLRNAGYNEHPSNAKLENNVQNTLSSEKMPQIEEIKKELQKAGFAPTPKLISNICRLNDVTGEKNSLENICNTYKTGCENISAEGKVLVEKIAAECKLQEMQQRSAIIPER